MLRTTPATKLPSVRCEPWPTAPLPAPLAGGGRPHDPPGWCPQRRHRQRRPRAPPRHNICRLQISGTPQPACCWSKKHSAEFVVTKSSATPSQPDDEHLQPREVSTTIRQPSVRLTEKLAAHSGGQAQVVDVVGPSRVGLTGAGRDQPAHRYRLRRSPARRQRVMVKHSVKDRVRSAMATRHEHGYSVTIRDRWGSVYSSLRVHERPLPRLIRGRALSPAQRVGALSAEVSLAPHLATRGGLAWPRISRRARTSSRLPQRM